MDERRFLSVHRKFTADERMRFERVKHITATNQTKLMADAEDKWAAMEAAFAAMQVLKAEREKRGISLTELATRTGIDKSNLSRLENDINAKPTLDTLMRTARALGGTIEFVFRDAAYLGNDLG